MTHRHRILLLIPHLGGGGAEHVTGLLATHLSSRKYDLHLALVTGIPTESTPLPPSVTIHCLHAERTRAGALPLLRLVRRLRPSLILSGMAHLNLLVLMLRPFLPAGTRLLVRHNGAAFSAAPGNLHPRTRFLHRMFLPRADRIICQSHPMAQDLHTELRIAPEKFVVLQNPVDLERIRKASRQVLCRWSGPGPHLLAVGRLSPEKGFDLLLEALSEVRNRHKTADLAIAGKGDTEAALRAQGYTLGLSRSVDFLGHIDAPESWFRGATLFILPSRQDAMPNALLEAAAASLPIVATPASTAVVNLLRHQPGVWLASECTAASLARSIVAALDSLTPGQRFAHPWVEPFRLSSAIARYESLIDAHLADACA